MPITTSQLKKKFIDFFVSKAHKEISGKSLIPENDPTVLFTTAGMHPLVPYLNGEKHPAGKRLVNCQRCIRTGDIDEVGDNSHLTFFEMLGNWSLGDYFKEDSIAWSFEFLTSPKWLNIPITMLAVTVFEGDNDAPKDTEAFNLWKNLGIPEDKISFLPKSDNWWGPAGQTGPCGPDTEIFFYVGDGIPGKDSNVKSDPKNWVEIWNNVFMQYRKKEDGSFEELAQKNVDTGMGVERTVTILNGFKNVYEVGVLKELMDYISANSSSYDLNSSRIVCDHFRTIAFMAMDGIKPSNLDSGYIMRRLIRRMVRKFKQLGLNPIKAVNDMYSLVMEVMKCDYPKLELMYKESVQTIQDEVIQFEKTLERGLKTIEKLEEIDGKIAFDIYQTYGFPLEMIQEEVKKRGLKINEDEFNEEFKKHQELSRSGSEQKFKGGLVDASEETTKLHTATHLLHQALRIVLGDHVAQRGSNITAERLRFDFSHPDKMTDEEIKKVSDIVNEQIKKALPVTLKEMTVKEAKEKGAIGLFESKYEEVVKVYTVGTDEDFFSREICGGPHMQNTSELGSFQILKEESSSKGIRRIKAVVS